MEHLTARSILSEAVRQTDAGVRDFFKKKEPFIRFTSGRSVTIEDEITKLSTSGIRNPFPLVAMFTEGMSEWSDGKMYGFSIPKIAIIIRTKLNTTEEQKLHDSFQNVLHPIYREFEFQLRKMYFGYGLRIEHTDLPCMSDSSGKTSLNQLCDAVIVRNLKFRYLTNKC